MVTKGLNKITQNETQDLQLVDNFCKSWVLKLDKKSQQSYRKREQAILEKELLSSLIDREINAQKNLDNSVERFRSLPPEVQEKILRQIGRK